MKKIISLFQRNYDGDRLVRDEIVPGAEWVAAGEGVATRKWDGTCCLIKGAQIYKRYDAKHGKTPPPGFIPAQEPDPVTGHHPGWLKCDPAKPEDKWHFEGLKHWLENTQNYVMADKTFELCGPRINGNPEKLERHTLIPHGMEKLDAPRTFSSLKLWLEHQSIEGVVWHHPDGRMVKIKRKDFGFK